MVPSNSCGPLPLLNAFERKSKEEVCETVLDEFNKVCSALHGSKEFVVTKSVGEILDYKIRALPDDLKNSDIVGD